MLEFIIAHYDWLMLPALTIVGAIIGHAVDLMVRRFAKSVGKRLAVGSLISLPLIIGVLVGANRFVAPYLEEECCRDRVTQWLTQSPAYGALVAHHPEAKAALVRAGVKMGLGGTDAPVGQVEFSAVLNHYLRLYLPVTSDAAARELVMAMTAIVDQMLVLEPELCVDLLNGDGPKMARRLPPHVFTRYGNAVGRVITDGIKLPQGAPDSKHIRWQQQRVGERMARDGNPLARDPNRLTSDPSRACFALLAIFDAVSKTVPPEEIGAFLRGAIPGFLRNAEI